MSRAAVGAAESAPGARRVRVVTAASLFDGHDAAINIMRRILQAQGAEVIHLGHDRSVDEIVSAAIQEDAHAIAVSSYQGGHDEFFRYMVDLLRDRGAGNIRVYGGGGGTILPGEIEALEAYGVARLERLAYDFHGVRAWPGQSGRRGLYGHRGRGEVERPRRAGAALPARLSCGEHRASPGRPDASAVGWRAARRSNPDERDPR